MNNPYAQLRQSLGRPLFVPFMVVGDPNPHTSVELIETPIASGADALELGLPFSDPPADGPVIQAADTRTLKAGVTMNDCFDVLRTIRNKHDLPIGLLVYFNLVLQSGIDRFYQECAELSITSVLIADLPLEHAEEVLAAARKHGVHQVFLVTSLSSDERIQQIAAVASGYIYVVSYLGVTGVENAVMGDAIKETIDRIRPHTDLPLVVGFGINTPEQVRAAAGAGADGVIVASRLVKEVPDAKLIGELCVELKRGCMQ